ncbi:hypothetical protein CBF45_04075 [Bordetella sp. J329]|nr:hypothetical protein CBF45_04075 [Bordetella sp. J329]
MLTSNFYGQSHVKTILSSIEPSVESASKLAGACVKLSIALGCITAIFYSLRIGYFPQGMTLGDGLLFLVVAGCFGAVYAIFLGSMVSLGISIAWLLRPMLQGIFWGVSKILRTNDKQVYQLARFAWWSVPYALIGVIFAVWLAGYDWRAYLNLFLMVVALYVFYSLAVDTGARYKQSRQAVEPDEASTMAPEQSKQPQAVSESPKPADLNRHKHLYFVSIAVVVLLPLLMSNAIGQLLDGAMRLAQIRAEHSILYVKAPYNQMLPQSLEVSTATAPQGFTAYEKVVILFRGVGDAIVVSFKDGDYIRQLDLPNDHVMVERRQHLNEMK